MADATGCIQWKESLVPAVCQAPNRLCEAELGDQGRGGC